MSSWEQKRKEGYSSSFGKLKIKGGLLPKRGSIGNIDVYFDGQFPKYAGSSGKKRIYKTDGNLQVIFHNPKDAEETEFLGNIIDIYYDYK